MAVIGVIVPIYNVESYLNRCIDSILNQTFHDFDLILVDDGSPDKSGDICDKYVDKDDRVKVIHKNNGGLSDARNTGIEWTLTHSDCKWITFIDSDDWIHPDYLLFLYKAICETNLNLCVARYIRVDSYQKFQKLEYHSRVYSTQDLFVKERINMTITCGKLFKKEDFLFIRFPVGKLHEDEFTTYKLLFKNEKIVFLNIPLYYYFINPVSIINSAWNIARLASIDAFEEQTQFFQENNYSRAFASSARALYTSCAKTIKNLREYYPYKYLLRIKYLNKYYFLKCKGYRKFLTNDDKRKVFMHVHPCLYIFIKWIKKKKNNMKEILGMK